MAIRIRSHWSNEGRDRSLPEIATALAFIAWRLAVDKAINLHCERFIYRDDAQRLGVIQEYLIFLIQIADRLAHGQLDDADRRTLIVSLARKVGEHLQDNGQELLGPGDYCGAFVAALDRRADDDAAYRFDQDGPSYAWMRHLGFAIQSLMGETAENRWVIDQVMDRDGWEAYRSFARAFRDLL